MAFFDVSLSDIVTTGADAFTASKNAEIVEDTRKTAEAKTSEASILAQAQAAGNQAVLFAKENQKTFLIIGGVLALGYFAMKGGK